ncbi:hypothetical protein Q8F55_005448 [Vanrija albida]|uniref:Uncharacterized protein n=1 Tax=Vanrija albida TaxID=181172 RepID=A0ABR3Q1W5_9TREE
MALLAELVFRLHVKPVLDTNLVRGQPLAPLKAFEATYPRRVDLKNDIFYLTPPNLHLLGVGDDSEPADGEHTPFFRGLIAAVNTSAIRELWLDAPLLPAHDEYRRHVVNFVTLFLDRLRNPALSTLLVANAPLHRIHDNLVRYLTCSRSFGLHFLVVCGKGQAVDFWTEWLTAKIATRNGDLLQIRVCNCDVPFGGECVCVATPIYRHMGYSQVLVANGKISLMALRAAVKVMIVCHSIFQPYILSRASASFLASPLNDPWAAVAPHSRPRGSRSSFHRLPLEIIGKIMSFYTIPNVTNKPTKQEVLNFLRPLAVTPAPRNQTTVSIQFSNQWIDDLVHPVNTPPWVPPPGIPPLTENHITRIIKYASRHGAFRRMVDALGNGEGALGYSRAANRLEFYKQVFVTPALVPPPITVVDEASTATGMITSASRSSTSNTSVTHAVRGAEVTGYFVPSSASK